MAPESSVDHNVGLSSGVVPGCTGEFPRLEVEGLWAVDLVYLSLPTPKPMKCYNRKLRGNKFLNLDDSLTAEAMSLFSALHVSSVAVGFGLSSELLVSEEED
jgi:hypothetical protein